MDRWMRPNFVGLVLFALFLFAQALVGRDDLAARPDTITQEIQQLAPREGVFSFGLPTVGQMHLSPYGERSFHILWMPLAGVLFFGWAASMVAGRLAIDGGVDPIDLPLLPPRRHPLFWIVAYLAAVPLIAAPAALIDWSASGAEGLFSPSGPRQYPLFVLLLVLAGAPILVLVLAIQRLIDRRRIGRGIAAQPVQPARPTAGAAKSDWPF